MTRRSLAINKGTGRLSDVMERTAQLEQTFTEKQTKIILDAREGNFNPNSFLLLLLTIDTSDTLQEIKIENRNRLIELLDAVIVILNAKKEKKFVINYIGAPETPIQQKLFNPLTEITKFKVYLLKKISLRNEMDIFQYQQKQKISIDTDKLEKLVDLFNTNATEEIIDFVSLIKIIRNQYEIDTPTNLNPRDLFIALNYYQTLVNKITRYTKENMIKEFLAEIESRIATTQAQITKDTRPTFSNQQPNLRARIEATLNSTPRKTS